MERHHAESIQNVIKAFENDASVRALLLGGSLAHGFARPDSDIDVSIIVDGDEYLKRKRENRVVYVNKELCTYEGGYVDGKIIDMEFLKAVADRGSDAARFAFKDCRILFSRVSDLERVLTDVTRYPVEKKEDRKARFSAQLLAWKWYYSEAVKKENPYLFMLSLQKLALFGGRIVLNENEMLYPYHKWFLKVLESAPRKPENLMADLDGLFGSHSWEKVSDYSRKILAFIGTEEKSIDWPNRFLKDSEVNWMDVEPPVDDL